MSFFKKKITILISFIGLLVILFLIFLPQKEKKEPIPEKIQPLLSSIVVNESARFHPLLRSRTYNEIKQTMLEKLKSYLVVNADTGEVYTAKNATQKISPASLTKIMTSMIALDIASESAKLKASDNAANQEPTHLGVKPGEIFTLEELVKASIMTSANDAATIIGEETLKPFGGSQKEFISFMNKKAEVLGLGDTHFTNTQGFDDENQYSNAFDLSRIAHYAHRNYPLIRKAAATEYSTIEETENHGFYHLPNWNALLGTYPGVNGLKIGYTENSGYSTIVTATKDDVSLIAVIIGAESIIDRDLAAATLLNFAFQKEEFESVVVNQDLIQPRLDDWKELRYSILKQLEEEKDK